MAQYSTSMNETDKIREGRKYIMNKHGEEKGRDMIKNFAEEHSLEMIISLAYDNTGATDDETRFLAFASLNTFPKEKRNKWLRARGIRS